MYFYELILILGENKYFSRILRKILLNPFLILIPILGDINLIYTITLFAQWYAVFRIKCAKKINVLQGKYKIFCWLLCKLKITLAFCIGEGTTMCIINKWCILNAKSNQLHQVIRLPSYIYNDRNHNSRLILYRLNTRYN